MSLDDLRHQIDAIDADLVDLLARRLKTAKAIGEQKRASGQPVVDPIRENIVLAHVQELAARAGIDETAVTGIYRLLIEASRGQQSERVAFQGEAGAYSEEATLRFFGPTAQTVPCETLEDVFQAVEQRKVSFGVVPVENSLEGSISKVYDLFLDSPLMVCGELQLRVSHCLIASPEASLDSIRQIYSHPQALGQCQAFLGHLGCELVPSYDTAGAVKMLKEKSVSNGAAVASRRAAAIYGMKILAEDIEDTVNNFTRFFILASHDAPPTGHDKTSIVFSVRHTAGALFSFLRVLADKNLSLTKIESRPTRLKPWDYNFYLDFEGHRLDEPAAAALGEMEAMAIFVKVLGSYPWATR